MNVLTRLVRHSAVTSRYGGLCMFSSVPPTPAKDIEKLVSSNKVVVFMKGNPEVGFDSWDSCEMPQSLNFLFRFAGTSMWFLKCGSPGHEDARSELW